MFPHHGSTIFACGLTIALKYEADRITHSSNGDFLVLSQSRSISKEESVIAVWIPMGVAIVRELVKGIMDEVYCITFSKGVRILH